MPKGTEFRFRRGTAAEWASRNPILAPGEPGILLELDGTTQIKIGDGATPWSLLPFVQTESTGTGGGETPIDLTDHVNDETPHPVYDDGPSLLLLYLNAKV
jgi:hypothetical protein